MTPERRSSSMHQPSWYNHNTYPCYHAFVHVIMYVRDGMSFSSNWVQAMWQKLPKTQVWPSDRWTDHHITNYRFKLHLTEDTLPLILINLKMLSNISFQRSHSNLPSIKESMFLRWSFLCVFVLLFSKKRQFECV